MVRLELSEDQLKTVLEILKYSLDACAVESISDKVTISQESVQEIIAKLEETGVAA